MTTRPLFGSSKVTLSLAPTSKRRKLILCHTGIKAKVENRGQYHEYLRELESLRKELGIDLLEELYPAGVANERRNELLY